MEKRQYIIDQIVDYYKNVAALSFDDVLNTQNVAEYNKRLQEETERDVDAMISNLSIDTVFNAIDSAGARFEHTLDCLYACS